MSITNERLARGAMKYQRDHAYKSSMETAEIDAVEALCDEVERLRRELAELRKPAYPWAKYTQPSDHTLLSVSLGDIAMSPNISDGDKAVIDAAIRVVKRDAAMSKPVTALPVEVEKFFESCDTCHGSIAHPCPPCFGLRNAILKALNERGGGA